MNKNLDRIEQVSTSVLRPYIGVAAPFVVSDAIRKTHIHANLDVSMIVPLLLQGIANELPQHLPVSKIMAEIKNHLTIG